jgi:hypothetical protein
METHNKKGELTAYGYACGYITKLRKGEVYKELYKEGGVYHVRSNYDNIKLWECFDTLKEAKAFFKLIKIDGEPFDLIKINKYELKRNLTNVIYVK